MAAHITEPIARMMRDLARRSAFPSVSSHSSGSPSTAIGADSGASPRVKALAAPWDGFVTGPENALALGAMEALARGKEWGASPLVVHGPPGSGKSRLMQGLVAEWLTRRPDSPLAVVSGDEFVTACLEAGASSGSGGWFDLRDRFRGVDLLAIDDLRAIERSSVALEELAFTMDVLEEHGAVIAASAKTGPSQWTNWPKRLVSRFSAGLAVRVDPPGLDSRRRFLIEHAPKHRVRLASEAVELLAEAADGYRALEGWLNRLALIAKVEGATLNREQAQALLSDPGASDPHRFDRLIALVASRFGVTVRELKSAGRRRVVVEPRQIAMLLASRLTNLSIGEIGRRFGGRDPATVRHSCATARQRILDDPALAAAVDSLSAGFGDSKR